jgi:hypothetical protein
MSNKYTYTVPFTEEQLHHDYVELRMSQTEIAAKYGTTQKVVWRAMAKMGVASRQASKRDQRGPNNSTWRGGRILVAASKRPVGERAAFGNGYWYVLMPDHPNVGSKGYVAEHVLVATRERGAPLQPGEMVHHIDMNKHNNAPENLAICTAKEHGEYHNQLELLGASLLAAGLVTFTADGGYETTAEGARLIRRCGRV